MKTLHKILLLSTIVLSIGQGYASAQEPQNRGNRGSQMQNATPEQRAKMMTQRLSSQLELTAEQSAKIEKIYIDNSAKFKRDENTTREAIEKNRAEVTAEINKVLTPAQVEKYKQMGAHRGKGGNNGSPRTRQAR